MKLYLTKNVINTEHSHNLLQGYDFNRILVTILYSILNIICYTFSMKTDNLQNNNKRQLHTDLQAHLLALSDSTYQQFSAKLLPNIDPDKLLGVRLPLLRKLAKKMVREEGSHYLDVASFDTFEETMLYGMVLGYLSEQRSFEPNQLSSYLDQFLPQVDNWSICDSLCASLKIAKRFPEELFQIISNYALQQGTYHVRFFIVMGIYYYINETYLLNYLDLLIQIKHEDYYVNMGIAWALSMCFVKYPAKTLDYINLYPKNSFIFQKTIQKIKESKQSKHLLELLPQKV